MSYCVYLQSSTEPQWTSHIMYRLCLSACSGGLVSSFSFCFSNRACSFSGQNCPAAKKKSYVEVETLNEGITGITLMVVRCSWWWLYKFMHRDARCKAMQASSTPTRCVGRVCWLSVYHMFSLFALQYCIAVMNTVQPFDDVTVSTTQSSESSTKSGTLVFRSTRLGSTMYAQWIWETNVYRFYAAV